MTHRRHALPWVAVGLRFFRSPRLTDLPLARHFPSTDAPIFLAQSKGFFEQEGIKVAILEVSSVLALGPDAACSAADVSPLQPSDPSDCAGLVGDGTVDLGVKVSSLTQLPSAGALTFPRTGDGTQLLAFRTAETDTALDSHDRCCGKPAPRDQHRHSEQVSSRPVLSSALTFEPIAVDEVGLHPVK